MNQISVLARLAQGAKNMVWKRIVVAFMATIAIVGPAVAHHSWATQDTSKAYYVTGTVTYVRWGNPHNLAYVKVDKNHPVPEGFRDRELPPGSDAADGKLSMDSARPYNGDHDELHLTLAPPGWMERWGLKRPIEVGERIEAVGFVNVDGSEEFRPVMFWLADGQGVWQKLLAFPTPPEPAP